MRGQLRDWSRGIGIGLGALVCMMAVNAQPYAYVANKGNNGLAIVNVPNGTFVSVTVPAGPDGVAVTPDGSTAYVASSTVNSVSAVNLSSRSVIATIPVGTTPGAVAVSPNGQLVYVVDVNSAQATAISTATNSVVATIAVGAHPTSVAFSPDSTRAYVTSLWGNSVYVINTATNAVTSFSTGAGPSAVAVTPDGQHLYVTCQSINTVNEYDTAGNLVTSIAGFKYPISIAITPDGTQAFVANGNGASVSVINLSSNSLVHTTAVGSLPMSVAISPDGTQAYVANEFSYSMSVVDTSSYSVVKTVTSVGVYPIAVAAVPPSSGPTCSFQVAPLGNISFPQSGGSTTLNVTASASTCSWGVTGPNWVTLTPSATSGNGTVTISAGANNTTQALSGTITVAGQQFTVSEAGITCSYTVTLTNGSLSFGVNGGSATITVVTASACAWSASGPNWVTLTPSATSGSGTVGISAGANSGTQNLNGTITVAGQQFTVTEAGIVCNYTVTLTAGNLSFTSAGGSATITVVTQSPCTWTATGPGWVVLTPSATKGNGTVGVTAAANNTITPLAGTITVGGQQFSASEAGIPCTYVLSGNTSLPSSAGTGSVTVTAPVGCAWSATDTVDTWLSITSGASGNGSGTVSYSYSANNSTNTRPGTMTIASQSFGVTQAAFVFSPIRVNAGGAAYTDLNGNQWQADNGPGRSYSVTSATITDPGGKFTPIYQKAAYGTGAGLSYTFNVPNGTFSVTLHYAETYEMATNRRLMNISINNQPVDSNIDVFALANGANTAFSSTYPTTVSNGQITIAIAPVGLGATAMLSGIEIQ